MLMGVIQNTVYYCCVSKGGRVLYAYTGGGGGGGGEDEIEKVAALCLENIPPYHKWYFQTMGKKTFGFLIEDGYVFFAIADEGLGNCGVLQFLEHLRHEFRKVAKKGSSSSRSKSNSSSSICMQEQLVPVIHQLINSLEHVSETGKKWSPEGGNSTTSPMNDASGQIAITKAPLLGKATKQDRKKMKDHVISMRDVELQDHRRSSDARGGGVVDTTSRQGGGGGGGGPSSTSTHRDLGLTRTRSGTLNMRKKWCRQVRIVLAIDAAVCVVLFVIWLIVCGGTKCLK